LAQCLDSYPCTRDIVVMSVLLKLFAVLLGCAPLQLSAAALKQEISFSAAPHVAQKHHHHHHGHHSKLNKHAAVPVPGKIVAPSNALPTSLLHGSTNLLKAKTGRGELEVNGPLPADFSDRFAKEVAKATGCKPEDVRVLNTTVVDGHVGVDEIVFEAPADVIKAVEEQASDPDSKLATGPLRIFLIDSSDDNADEADTNAGSAASANKSAVKADAKAAAVKADGKGGKEAADVKDDAKQTELKAEESDEAAAAPPGLQPSTEEAEAAVADSEDGEEPTPVQEKGIDIDTSMPYGDLEPFGREDTAQELTQGSIRESDGMVDQLERAEVAEEKRAVFRALTRLRGAAITSFDGVARSQTGNIDSYARTNHWRTSHPVRHLADEENDVSKWAFPDNSDF